MAAEKAKAVSRGRTMQQQRGISVPGYGRE